MQVLDGQFGEKVVRLDNAPRTHLPESRSPSEGDSFTRNWGARAEGNFFMIALRANRGPSSPTVSSLPSSVLLLHGGLVGSLRGLELRLLSHEGLISRLHHREHHGVGASLNVYNLRTKNEVAEGGALNRNIKSRTRRVRDRERKEQKRGTGVLNVRD